MNAHICNEVWPPINVWAPHVIILLQVSVIHLCLKPPTLILPLMLVTYIHVSGPFILFCSIPYPLMFSGHLLFSIVSITYPFIWILFLGLPWALVIHLSLKFPSLIVPRDLWSFIKVSEYHFILLSVKAGWLNLVTYPCLQSPCLTIRDKCQQCEILQLSDMVL